MSRLRRKLIGSRAPGAGPLALPPTPGSAHVGPRRGSGNRGAGSPRARPRSARARPAPSRPDRPPRAAGGRWDLGPPRPVPPRPGGPEGEKPRPASAGPELQVWPAEGRALSALTAIPGQALWAQSSRRERRSFPAGRFPSPSRLPPLGLAQAGSKDWWTSALRPKQPLLIKPRKGLAS